MHSRKLEKILQLQEMNWGPDLLRMYIKKDVKQYFNETMLAVIVALLKQILKLSQVDDTLVDWTDAAALFTMIRIFMEVRTGYNNIDECVAIAIPFITWSNGLVQLSIFRMLSTLATMYPQNVCMPEIIEPLIEATNNSDDRIVQDAVEILATISAYAQQSGNESLVNVTKNIHLSENMQSSISNMNVFPMSKTMITFQKTTREYLIFMILLSHL